MDERQSRWVSSYEEVLSRQDIYGLEDVLAVEQWHCFVAGFGDMLSEGLARGTREVADGLNVE